MPDAPSPYPGSMASEKKQPKKPKPGPEPEILKIEGDPLAAFDKMVRHDPEAKAKKKADKKGP